jgi:16S rRNA (adenine1518-N6/adenine1519-N6)-dimethyltransferase
MRVRAKKYLGQHFLNDKAIALQIVDSLEAEGVSDVLEVGPGMGVLTQYLLKKSGYKTTVVEIDNESIEYLKQTFPEIAERIIEGDFLKLNLRDYFQQGQFALIGNFPYNISSQIFFKVLENRDYITEVVGMLQKEVAERISAGPGSKTYGILSVFLQAWYNIDYLFTVHENVFTPPPRVKSAVIRLKRNENKELGCDEKLFFRVVKQGFNQRRKMLRNSLKGLIPTDVEFNSKYLTQRPEQLSVSEFVELTNEISQCQ